jgi:hypothetical protein
VAQERVAGSPVHDLVVDLEFAGRSGEIAGSLERGEITRRTPSALM